MLVTCIGVFSVSGCKGKYGYSERDFSLEISVNKTEASIGDDIEINAVLKNLSGKDINCYFLARKFLGIGSVRIKDRIHTAIYPVPAQPF